MKKLALTAAAILVATSARLRRQRSLRRRTPPTSRSPRSTTSTPPRSLKPDMVQQSAKVTMKSMRMNPARASGVAEFRGSDLPRVPTPPAIRTEGHVAWPSVTPGMSRLSTFATTRTPTGDHPCST